jgi:hypothetical protein
MSIIRDMEQTSSAPQKAANAAALMQELSAACKRMALYPEGHPTSSKAAERPYQILTLIWERQPQSIISIVDDKLVADGKPLEERFLADGLGRAMVEANIQSVTFDSKLQIADFEAFLAYLNVKAEERDLIGFLKEREIAGIMIDKWHYELVGDHEKVVDADAVTGVAGSDSGLHSSLSDMVREHPGIIVSLLSSKNSPGAGAAALAGLFVHSKVGGADTITTTEAGELPGAGGEVMAVGATGDDSRADASSAAAGEPQMVPDPDTVLRELDELNDKELVLLLVAGLREAVTDEKLQRSFNSAQALLAIRELLEQKENSAVLHALKKSLSAAGIIESRYLDLIFNQEADTAQIACEEAERFLEIFQSGEPESSLAGDLVAWLQRIEDVSYISDFVRHFFEMIAGLKFTLNSAQEGTLAHLLDLLRQDSKSELAIYYRDEVIRRLQDPAIGLTEVQLVGRQVEFFYFTAIELCQFEIAAQMLHEVNQKALGKQIHADGVAGYAWDLRLRLSSAQAVETITRGLAEDFAARGRSGYVLLQQFGGTDAALGFAGKLMHPERGIRLLTIRLLSEMGEDALAAVRVELAEPALRELHPQEIQVPEMVWYRLRNIILVLGNTGHPDAVELLEPLSDYRDERVAEEVIIALDKLHWDDATRILAKLLSHPERRVHTHAVRSLATRKAEVVYPMIEDYFLRHPSVQQQVLTLLTGIDKVRAGAFLASVLTGESKEFRKTSRKPDEALNEMIVKTFIGWKSPVANDVLRRYVRGATRSLFGQLRKATSVKLAENYLRSLDKR